MTHDMDNQRRYQREWRLKNRDRRNARQRARRKANLEAAVAYDRAWKATNRPRLLGDARARAAVKRAYIDSLKVGGCVDCGNKNLVVLDFDHLRDKKADFAHLSGASFRRIDEEAAKCEVRCANCHRIKTNERRGAA